MSSPARAEGYDKHAQQREDSTTFIVVKVSSERSTQDSDHRVSSQARLL